MKMDELIKPAVKAVEDGEIQLIPKSMEKTYFNWTNNIKDWCISRQLWWGHRIPAWYCDDCGETIVASEAPEKCPKCGSKHIDKLQRITGYLVGTTDRWNKSEAGSGHAGYLVFLCTVAV